ncbi:hypothetical protein BKA69DRAFT_1074621 [Paraphysoderma sedebokerense]|nr:hypothetical protein BKA69DRAFT_1074621 [Paraphysoderma sedebokerense]
MAHLTLHKSLLLALLLLSLLASSLPQLQRPLPPPDPLPQQPQPQPQQPQPQPQPQQPQPQQPQPQPQQPQQPPPQPQQPQQQNNPPAKNATAANQTSDDFLTPEWFKRLFTLQPAIVEGNKVAKFPNGTLNTCFYVSTPLNGTSVETWTCPAGFFCPFPGNQTRCGDGFYCPGNTSQPLYCCEGYFCPRPSRIQICPQGSYCPKGSNRPYPCNFVANCPEGTGTPHRIGILWIVIVFTLFTWFFFYLKSRHDNFRSMKYSNYLSSLPPKSLKSIGSPTTFHRHTESETLNNADPLSKPLPTPFDYPTISRKNIDSFSLQFTNLSLTLPSGHSVLSNVSGELKSGRTCAIMGPSGSGKTTFLHVLMGKVKRTGGDVYINGEEGELKDYKKLVGMVPQDDIMLPELTVLDTLMHSAKTRLPADYDFPKRKRIVVETMDFLSLTPVMNSKIGDVQSRGISGGQKKRVNLGMELVAEPSVLFLDEPTSGLDSSTATEVCGLLDALAKTQNLTIAAVIHSPSPPAFKHFDDLILLGRGGKLVYHGEREFAVSYFQSLGFAFNPENDVSESDWLMDVVSGKIRNLDNPDFDVNGLSECWGRYQRGESIFPTKLPFDISDSDAPPSDISSSHFLSDFFSHIHIHISSTLYDIQHYILDVFSELKSTFSFGNSSKNIRQTPSGFMIFWLCFKRSCLQIYRSPGSFLMDQLVHLGCGAFISIASENLDYLGKQPDIICELAPAALRLFCQSPIDRIREVGVFLSLGVLFAGISTSISTFGNERHVFFRESASGQSALPYFLAKVLADVPRLLIAAFMFSLSLILVWPYRSHFLLIYSIVALLYLTAFGMGYLLSIVIRKESVGLVGTGFALSWSIVFSGVIPSLETVKSRTSNNYDGFSWLWDLSTPRWAIEALYIVEVTNRPFAESKGPVLSYTYDTRHLVPAIIYAAVIGLGWNFLAFLALKLVDRDRQR